MNAARRAAGFTMVELIVVMILLGVVAAVAAPRLMGNNPLTAVSLRDQIQAALRSAQKSAVARRRVVCATRAGAGVPTFTIAREIGAASCTLAFPNPIDVSGLGTAPTLTYGTGLPANLFFQPNGAITSDIGGANPVAGAISFSDDGVTYTIQLDGVTGYVE